MRKKDRHELPSPIQPQLVLSLCARFLKKGTIVLEIAVGALPCFPITAPIMMWGSLQVASSLQSLFPEGHSLIRNDTVAKILSRSHGTTFHPCNCNTFLPTRARSNSRWKSRPSTSSYTPSRDHCSRISCVPNGQCGPWRTRGATLLSHLRQSPLAITPASGAWKQRLR